MYMQNVINCNSFCAKLCHQYVYCWNCNVLYFVFSMCTMHVCMLQVWFYDNKCIHPTRVTSTISNPQHWRPMRFRERCRRWCHIHEPALVLELAWSSREQVTIRTSAMGHLWWQIDVRTSSERPCCWCLVLLGHVMDYMLCNDFLLINTEKSHLKSMHCL